MKLVPTFAVMQLTPSAEPVMLTKFPLSQYGWVEFGTFLVLRGGRQVAADAGIYLMIDYPRSKGKWQRCMMKYHASLDYVDVQRFLAGLRSIVLNKYEEVKFPSQKALWSGANYYLSISFGPVIHEGYGEVYFSSFKDTQIDVLISPEFLLCDNDGVLCLSYED